MPINLMYDYWLEQEVPAAIQAPTSDPTTGAAVQEPPPEQSVAQEPEIQEPVAPEMPEEPEEPKDFEIWRQEFFKLAVKGNPQEMMKSIKEVKDLSGLDSPKRKFVEDNYEILILRQNPNVDQASGQIRKLIKSNLDRNNPGVSVMQHITSAIEEADAPILKDVFIKLAGLYGLKSDLYRKYIASLLGALQIGGGGDSEDIAYSDKDYSIRMYTRFFTEFGKMNLGKWGLQKDDPDRYLKEAELERLSDGSPEEKQVLRRRVVIESIAEKFRNRSFLINVVNPENGTIYFIGWDMSDSLLGAYSDGKIVVRSKESSGDNEVLIDNDGNIVSILDLNIYYLKETTELDENGYTKKKEIPFIEKTSSMLYLNAPLEIIRDVSTSFSGFFFKEVPYAGNPSDIVKIMSQVPNLEEILMRRVF